MPTVVMIHGLTGTSRWWVPVIRHLPPHIGVAALDVRGRGASWQAPGPHDLPTVADDVARVLDHLSVERAVIAGYSMGGWVAAIVGARHGDRVSRVILVDGGLPLEVDETSDPEEMVSATVGPAVARLGMEFATVDDYFAFWRQHPAMTEPWGQLHDEVFRYDLLDDEDGVFSVRSNRDAIVTSAKGFLTDPVVNRAHLDIACPCTLITVDHGLLGEPGGFMSGAAAEAAAGANSNIRVLSLRDLNHYTLMLGSGAPIVAEAITRPTHQA